MEATSAHSGRDSSVELLRCICMALIIAHHYVFHGGIPALDAETWCAGRVFLEMLLLYGKMSCSVFAILTGYYLSVSAGTDHYKKWIVYYAQVLFYSLACLLVMHWINGAALNAKSLIRAAFPLVYGNWFAQYFLLLYLFIPFLNRMLGALSDRELSAFTLMAVIVWSVIPTLFRFKTDYGDMVFFLMMYILGTWLRRNERGLSLWPARVYALAAILCALIIAAPTLLLDTLRYEHGARIAFLENDETYFATINALPALLCAVALVLCFQRLSFHNAYVNILGRTVFGVYMIHDNAHVRSWLWTRFWPNAKHWTSPWLHAPLKIFFVFAVCAGLELLRQRTIGARFDRWLDRCWADIARGFSREPNAKHLRVRNNRSTGGIDHEQSL